MAQIDIDLEHYNSGFGSHDGWVDINNSSNLSQNQWQNQGYEEFGLTLPIQDQLPSESSCHTTHRQLLPLIMPSNPVWPSMSTNPASYSTLVAPSLVKGNAPRLPSTHATPSPRKTLTDSDRRRMCQYHEENPSIKQTEIGAMFGVERSTVSKVLKKKEQYLCTEDHSLSPVKQTKGKFPDMERALANWVRKSQKEGVSLTDDAIKEKAEFFATAVDNKKSHLKTNSTSWLEKFKQKNGIGAGKSTRKSSNSLNPESEGDSALQSPTGTSSISPDALPPPPPFVSKTESNSGSWMSSQQSRQAPTGRSQTFPMLGIDPSFISSQPTSSTPDSSTHKMPPPFGIEPPVSSSSLHHSSSNGSTASPSSTLTTSLHSPPRSSAPESPTQDDAQRALDTVLKYLQQAPLVDQNEYMTFLKLAEKLRFPPCSGGALPKGLHGISEHPTPKVEQLGSADG